MNLQKFSSQSQDFQSQKLIVDYISFKFRSLDDNQERKIWSCLFELGFNSYQMSGKLSNPIKIDLFTNWDGVDYRKVTCIVRDFIKFQNPTISRTNRYQLKQTKEFFDEVQTGILQTSFTSTHFQSLVSVPKVEFHQSKSNKPLVAKVWIVEELFYYNYPFHFPDLLNQKFQKHEFSVLAYFIQTFSCITIAKRFDLKKFFGDYSSLDNRDVRKVKEYFIKYIKLFHEYNLIDDKIQILSTDSISSLSQLTTSNISEGFIIYENLTIE